MFFFCNISFYNQVISFFAMAGLFAVLPFSTSYILLIVIAFFIGITGGGIIADSYKMIQDHFDVSSIPWVVGYDTVCCYASATAVQLLLGK